MQPGRNFYPGILLLRFGFINKVWCRCCRIHHYGPCVIVNWVLGELHCAPATRKLSQLDVKYLLRNHNQQYIKQIHVCFLTVEPKDTDSLQLPAWQGLARDKARCSCRANAHEGARQGIIYFVIATKEKLLLKNRIRRYFPHGTRLREPSLYEAVGRKQMLLTWCFQRHATSSQPEAPLLQWPPH